MTKDQLIILLKKYKENKAKLKLKLRDKERILRQLESIKEIELKSSVTEINSDIHSKNSISDKVGNAATNNSDKENNLRLELEVLEKEIIELNAMNEEIDIRLDALRRKEKEILIAYYVEGYTYKEIGNKTYYDLYQEKRSEDTIKKIIQRATNKIVSF